MREITPAPVIVFLGLLSLAITLALITTTMAFGALPLGDFRGVLLISIGVVLVYAYAILIYRGFLHLRPLPEGDIAAGSTEEFTYHVYLLFYLILFYSLTRSRFIPVPIMRGIYLALGAKLGHNTYCAGTILDPPLTIVGDNTILGHNIVFYSHAIEGQHLSHATIRVGNNVTIGANAVIMSGVTIHDGAIIAAGAVVGKDKNIAAGEVWGGIPAKRIR